MAQAPRNQGATASTSVPLPIRDATIERIIKHVIFHERQTLITHLLPVSPKKTLPNIRFHVQITSATQNATTAATCATASCRFRLNGSKLAGSPRCPVIKSASAVMTIAMTHERAVLNAAALSLAAINRDSCRGNVPVNGGTP